MTELSKRLPDDNKKLAPLVREISLSENLIPYCDLPKVQPLVAQIDWSHNLNIFQRCKDHLIRELEYFTGETVMLAAIIKKNFEEVEV
ncbi:MAG: hypothetical protein C4B58_09670 [Deltaproteobacteria bacterium]|nr:MAG: hypothetical protein C4B58_09670 [Deltaproteobacteria bacterium]